MDLPDLTHDARLRLYQLVGYPQGVPKNIRDAEFELRSHGLMNGDQETSRAHAVAEVLLFS